MAVLVLDCDGVVVTGHAQGGRWDKDLARDLGLDPARLQEKFFRPYWRSIVHGQADMLTVLEDVWPSLDCARSPHDFVAYWFAKDSALDGEVLSEVASWRAAGGHACLATVQEHHRASHLWNALSLSNHFDAIHYSAVLGAAKPDAAFYERVQAKLPASRPQDVIFLDDAPRNVEAASAFGWRAALFTGVEDLRKAFRP